MQGDIAGRHLCHDIFNVSSTEILRPRVRCNARVRDVIETALAARATYAVVHVLRVGLTAKRHGGCVRACVRARVRACGMHKPRVVNRGFGVRADVHEMRNAQTPFC